jgi:hypothetical protein
MSEIKRTDMERRALLRQGGLLLAVLSAAVVVPAQADDDMLSQAAVHYQPTPHGAQHCSVCAYFIPGKDASGPGSCRLVAGAISPTGWCERFSS